MQSTFSRCKQGPHVLERPLDLLVLPISYLFLCIYFGHDRRHGLVNDLGDVVPLRWDDLEYRC